MSDAATPYTPRPGSKAELAWQTLEAQKIVVHCVDMLDLMALANASQREARAGYIEQLLTRHRAVTVLLRVGHDKRWISPALWGESIKLLGSVGAQDRGHCVDRGFTKAYA